MKDLVSRARHGYEQAFYDLSPKIGADLRDSFIPSNEAQALRLFKSLAGLI